MPHILIEHSESAAQTIEEVRLARALHRLVIDFGLFSPDAVKTRTHTYNNYLIGGDLEQTAFIHVTVKILSGRDRATRESLSDEIFTLLKEMVPEIPKLSVDIHEMSKDTYRKT